MSDSNRQQLIAWWMIWGSLLTGIFIMHQFIGSPATGPVSGHSGGPVWLAAVVPLAVSAVIRWLLLPRAPSAAAALPMFVVGLALAESTFIFGMFLFPAHRQELLILSALGIIQYVPFFASRYHD